jgi:hypothetical protein
MNNTHYKGKYGNPHSQKKKKQFGGWRLPATVLQNALYAVLPSKTTRFGNYVHVTVHRNRFIFK